MYLVEGTEWYKLAYRIEARDPRYPMVENEPPGLWLQRKKDRSLESTMDSLYSSRVLIEVLLSLFM